MGAHATASRTTAAATAAVTVGTLRSAAGRSSSLILLMVLGMVWEGNASVWTRRGVLLLVAESSVLQREQSVPLLLLLPKVLLLLACCSGVALLDQRGSLTLCSSQTSSRRCEGRNEGMCQERRLNDGSRMQLVAKQQGFSPG